MPQLSDFGLGADVVAKDGSKAGTLASVLVEAEGFDPKALVVKDESTLAGRLVSDEKFFVTDEVVVPIAAVESASHDLIRLSLSVDDIRKQRSEEHTSELQSHLNIVCRLLLAKKKNHNTHSYST